MKYGGILAWVHCCSMNDVLNNVVAFREAFRLPATERADYLACACVVDEDLRRKILA